MQPRRYYLVYWCLSAHTDGHFQGSLRRNGPQHRDRGVPDHKGKEEVHRARYGQGGDLIGQNHEQIKGLVQQTGLFDRA